MKDNKLWELRRYLARVSDSSDPHFGPTNEWTSVTDYNPSGAARFFAAMNGIDESDTIEVKDKDTGIIYTFNIKNNIEKQKENLKPCPFCGSTNLSGGSWIVCNDCKAEGPYENKTTEPTDPTVQTKSAEERWNSRQ